MEKGTNPNSVGEGTTNQEALEQRLKGRLITLDIQGHVFYVDLAMGMLRPKDDFLSSGIHFHEIDHCLSSDGKTYQIPYNPQKHCFQEIDEGGPVELPKGIVVIEFPHERFLDPIGYSRMQGMKLNQCVKETGIQAHFTAKAVDWSDTEAAKALAQNQKRQENGKKALRPTPRGRRI